MWRCQPAPWPVSAAWLGVAMYLVEASVWAVLRYVMARPAGSAIVFDYALSPARLNPIERMVVSRFADRVSRAGEPWTACFDPDVLSRAWSISGPDMSSISTDRPSTRATSPAGGTGCASGRSPTSCSRQPDQALPSSPLVVGADARVGPAWRSCQT